MAQIASALRKIRLPDVGRWAQVVALILLFGLLAAMALGPIGQLIEQRDRMSQLSVELDEIKSNNSILEERIDRLQDPDYIEQKAREQSGLVRPGEISIVIMPPSKRRRAEWRAERKQARRQAASERAAAEAESGFVDDLVDFLGF